MITHPGFLAAIIANPADDTPRLIYADWLDDQGEADRAEFIRCQVELASLPAFDGVTMVGEANCEYKPRKDDGSSWNPHIGDSVTISGKIRASDMNLILQQQAKAGAIDRLASDLRIVLRFSGQEAPIAVAHEYRLSHRSKTAEARFRLFPVLDGEGFIWYRPYTDPHEEKRLRLEEREREILDTPGVWFDPPSLGIVGEWRRGFIADIICTAADWLAHADTFTTSQPIERVTLTTWPGRNPLHTTEVMLLFNWPGITFTLPEPEPRGTQIWHDLSIHAASY